MAVIGQFYLFGLICKIVEYLKITGPLYISLVETTLVIRLKNEMAICFAALHCHAIVII